MDPLSRAFKILNNSSNVNEAIEATVCSDNIAYDSDDESTTYLDLQPFVDSPDGPTDHSEPEGKSISRTVIVCSHIRHQICILMYSDNYHMYHRNGV